MLLPFRFRSLPIGLVSFVTGLCLASLTGCSGGSSGVAPAPAPPSFSQQSAFQAPLFSLDHTAKRIYVTTQSDNMLQAYTLGGAKVGASNLGLNKPQAVKVDASYKIYVANFNANTMTTYRSLGDPTTPTISVGLSEPDGVAVTHGKIYVTNFNTNQLTTYTSSGKKTVPTITAGLSGPGDIAVDAKGKIYVANFVNSTVTTYTAAGKQTKPTISMGLSSPNGVAIDDATGNIYVSNYGNSTITTYTAAGKQTTPTISAGLSGPGYIAIAAGDLFVANILGHNVTTYKLDGTQTTPTISGLAEPVGIAVR